MGNSVSEWPSGLIFSGMVSRLKRLALIGSRVPVVLSWPFTAASRVTAVPPPRQSGTVKPDPARGFPAVRRIDRSMVSARIPNVRWRNSLRWLRTRISRPPKSCLRPLLSTRRWSVRDGAAVPAWCADATWGRRVPGRILLGDDIAAQVDVDDDRHRPGTQAEVRVGCAS